MTDARPTLDQLRAKHAWQAVERARKLKQSQSADYAREAKRLPVRIKTSGLGQAVAFLKAKAGSGDGDPRSTLLRDLDDWLLKQRKLGTASNSLGGPGVISIIINGDARLLRRVTEESLLYLQWLTRFAEAEFSTEEDSNYDGT